MSSTDSRPNSVADQLQAIQGVVRALLADDFSVQDPVGEITNEYDEILYDLNLLAEKLQTKREFDEHTNRAQQRKSDLLESTLAELDEAKRRLSQEIGFAYIAAQDEFEPESKTSAIVRETGDELSGIASFDETLDAWACQARSLIGAHQAAVSYFPFGEIAEGKHAISLSDKYEKYRTYNVMPSGEGIWSRVIRQKLSFCMTDKELKSHPAWKNFSDLRDERGLEHPPMRGWLAVPVLSKAKKFVGLLQLSDKYEGDFTQDDLQRITRLAQLMAPTFSLQQANEELQQMTGAAQAASRAKGQFLANMSHEIRTPLTAMLGFAEMIQRDRRQLAESDLDDALTIIRRNGDHLRALINDILDLSKIEADELALESILISPSELVREVGALTQPRSEAKGLRLLIETEADVPAGVLTDATRLRQILLNLMNNAVKFTEAGEIRLRCSFSAIPTNPQCSHSPWQTRGSACCRNSSTACFSRSCRPTHRPRESSAVLGWG